VCSTSFCALRTASAFACSRIRTTSASSFANSTVRTPRRGWERRSKPVAAQGLAHAALDAIALMGFTEHLACSEAYAGTGFAWRLRCEKPAHRCGLPLASSGISALIVGVFAQACARDRLALNMLGRLD